MDETPNLSLPYIMPSQAQKSVTHNEALRMLDALVMASVVSRTISSPPASPDDGQRHIVPADADGAWAGKARMIAAMQDGDWNFYTPAEGWLAWCQDETALLYFTNGSWQATGAGEMQSIDRLGINATADTVNRLALKSSASLFDHQGSDHQLKINKADSSDTGSLLFQTGYSGRAEIGLAGDDHLHVKVSADGSAWTEALVIDATSGKVDFPQTNVLKSYALNLYQDGGRMAGNGASSITVGAFSWPSYLSLENGAIAAAHDQFVYDNADYGGSRASLDAAVKELIDRIRQPTYRQYNIEFWVAAVTAGAGNTSSALTVGSMSGHISLYTSFKVRPPALTHHAYVKALDQAILVNVLSGQVLYKDGVAYTSAFAVAPGEGWASITVHDEIDPSLSYGYQPTIFSIYAQTAGDRFLIACPALMAGIVNVDDNVGVIPAYNGWAA